MLPTMASTFSVTAFRAHVAARFGSNPSSHTLISIGRLGPPAGSFTPPAALIASAAALAPAGTSTKCEPGPVSDVRTPSVIGAPVGLGADVVVAVSPPPDDDFFALLPHATAANATTSSTATPSLRLGSSILSPRC